MTQIERTQAEREAYAELAEVAAQWKALSEWEAIQRLPSSNRSIFRTTLSGIPVPPALEEEPFPLERRLRPKRPSWFDLALPDLLSSHRSHRRSSGHADNDPAQLPRPRLRIAACDRR